MSQTPPVHPLALRLLHWINALAVLIMILSGWRIYNAAPIWDFVFPAGFTLGGWLAGALAWHFAAMWLLGANFLAWLLYGALTGHFRRRLTPIAPVAAWRDLRDLAAGRMAHEPGRYNAAQRLAYAVALLAILVAIVSGLALWKPVQLHELAALMGGYEGARRLHFAAMTALVVFIVAHVALALGVKGALAPMITGRPES
ncbi:MAG: cytochrome b/b6 domain-containing protein [Methylocystis sp.]|uniref:cytochrome b/b6 domain-containing protein n=1 Tax=Methylocystis sp. TaxID=1911079 RepID=UPI003DA4CB22